VLLRREHARLVVVWRSRLGDGRPLTESGEAIRADQARILPAARAARPTARTAARAVEARQLALGVPVAVIGEREMAALFGGAPDGWRAFFERYPGASGVAELSRATALPDGTTLVYVARQCGEQCAGVFRVLLGRDGRGRWVARAVEPLRAEEGDG